MTFLEFALVALYDSPVALLFAVPTSVPCFAVTCVSCFRTFLFCSLTVCDFLNVFFNLSCLAPTAIDFPILSPTSCIVFHYADFSHRCNKNLYIDANNIYIYESIYSLLSRKFLCCFSDVPQLFKIIPALAPNSLFVDQSLQAKAV